VTLKVIEMSFEATAKVEEYTPEGLVLIDPETEAELYPELFTYMEFLDGLETEYFEVIEANRKDKQQIINGLFKNE